MDCSKSQLVLTILTLSVPFSLQQYSTFTGENGCEVRIPFLESCRKSQTTAGYSVGESGYSSLEAQLRKIELMLQESDIHKKSLISGLFQESSFQNYDNGSPTVDLEDALEENCWIKVDHCQKDQTDLQSENVGLNKLLLVEKHRADRANARVDELAAEYSAKVVDLKERFEKCDAERADKVSTINTLEQSLTYMEASVGVMQQNHELQIASIKGNLTALQEMIVSRDKTLHILRDKVAELTKKLAFKNEVQCAQQRDISQQKEALVKPSGIVETSEISCEEGQITPTCVLVAVNTASDARCAFRQRDSQDFNWLYQSHKEMSMRMKSNVPAANPNACAQRFEYFYLDFSRLAIGQKAQLVTDVIREPGQRQCFTFWYMLHYNFNHGKFFVHVKVKNRYTAQIWQDYTQGTQGEWTKTFFDIPANVSDQGFQIMFVAEGNGPGYLSINSVTLTLGKCA